MLVMAATPLAARADITSRMTSSVQLQVNAAATQMQRVGNSYSISGNNVDTTDGTTANTVSAGAISSGVYGPGTISATQDNPVNHLASQLHLLKVMPLIQLDLL